MKIVKIMFFYVSFPCSSVELSSTCILPFNLSPLSASLSLHPYVHPFRKHQQRLRPGLHQRISDCQRAAGSRKPALLGRIHPHRQGELLNSRQLFHHWTVFKSPEYGMFTEACLAARFVFRTLSGGRL